MMAEATAPRSRARIWILVGLVAVAVVVIIGGLVAKDGQPSATETTAQIALVDDSGALFTYDASGGSKLAHPVAGVTFGFPAWSPDGKRIAVTGLTEQDGGVYVFEAGASTEPAVVYRSEDRAPFYLYWTPDSTRVSFLTTEPGEIALRVAPADASNQATVMRRGAPLYMDWFEADRAFLHVGLGADAFTGRVNAAGEEDGAAFEGTGVFRTGTVSHDGRYVAYATSEDGITGAIVIDGTSNEPFRVFGPAAMLFDPTGASLALIAADKPADRVAPIPLGPLKLIDPATSAVRTLLDGSVVAFFWSPDGKTIAALAAPGGDPGPVAGAGRVASAAAAPPPGRLTAAADAVSLRLVFIDVASGAVRSERAVDLAQLFVSQLLPYFDQYGLSHRLWSSDSAAILLPLVSASGQDQLVVIPADGSDDRVIAGGSKGFWRP
jgi:Tol biopolymer transport system component